MKQTFRNLLVLLLSAFAWTTHAQDSSRFQVTVMAGAVSIPYARLASGTIFSEKSTSDKFSASWCGAAEVLYRVRKGVAVGLRLGVADWVQYHRIDLFGANGYVASGAPKFSYARPAVTLGPAAQVQLGSGKTLPYVDGTLGFVYIPSRPEGGLGQESARGFSAGLGAGIQRRVSRRVAVRVHLGVEWAAFPRASFNGYAFASTPVRSLLAVPLMVGITF